MLIAVSCGSENSQNEAISPAAEGVPETSIVAGIFPFAPAAQVDELYGPLIRSMGENLGVTVHLRTASSFLRFTERIEEGRYDIALVQPFEYPGLIDSGYQPVARVQQLLSATLVASDDLQVSGKGVVAVVELRIGTPPEASAMRQLVDAELIQAGLDPAALDIRSFATHADCLTQLQLNTVDVCAVAPVPLREFERQTGAELQVVTVTEPVASIAFVAKPELDAGLVEQIQTYLVQLHENLDTAVLLELVGTSQFVVIEDVDYVRVRELVSLRADE